MSGSCASCGVQGRTGGCRGGVKGPDDVAEVPSHCTLGIQMGGPGTDWRARLCGSVCVRRGGGN